MVTRGEGDNRGKNGKCHQGTCIKDPQTKQKGGRTEGGGGGWMGENEDNCA